MRARRFAGGALLLMLGGCCAGVTTDPRAGGLAGGVCGEATGAYRGRIAAREDLLRSLDAANAALSDDLGASRAEAATLDRRLAVQRRAAAEDRAALARLEADFAAAERRGAVGRARKAALDAEIGQLDGELAGLIRRASQRELTLRALREGANTAREAREFEADLALDERRRNERRRELDALRQRLREASSR